MSVKHTEKTENKKLPAEANRKRIVFLLELDYSSSMDLLTVNRSPLHRT